MASEGQDSSLSLQGLFASLRSTSNSRTTSVSRPAPQPIEETSAQDTRHPHPFHPSTAANSSPQPQSTSIPSTLPSSATTTNPRNFNTNATMSKSPAFAPDPANTERTANLLNLLKFGPSTTSSQTTPQQPKPSRPAYGGLDVHSVHGRGISASDLVGSFMGKSTTPLSRENAKPPSSASHQDALLKLLNRSTSQAATPQQSPKPSRTQDEGADSKNLSQGPAATPLKKQTSQTSDGASRASRKESPIRYFGTSEAQPTPFEPQHIPKLETTPKKEPLFTYVNPFEQLAASSPRPAKDTTPLGDNHKRKNKDSSSEPTTSRRKVTPAGHEILQSIESPGPTPLDDGRTPVEALMGIGAPTKDAETVAEALNEVGSKVDKEAEKALAKAEARADELEKAADAKKEELEHAQKATLDAAAERVQEFASEVKTELDKEENEGVLEETLSAPVANALKDIIDEAAQNNTAEAWESDKEDERQAQGTPEGNRAVHVQQFPLKPFVSIEIKASAPPTLTIRDDTITHIARFRKEFDQIDRTLTSATNDFIVYASPKASGLRIIRQDDGVAKQVFTDHHDRIFNVSLNTLPSPGDKLQTVLATGVSGSVYWATISRPDTVVFDGDMVKEGIAFPPTAAQAENVSGGQLKTRAKKSSRHPHFFAIGRGKAIHIIFPYHAVTSEHLLGGNTIGHGNIVDTDNYLQERNIRIATGKAGKDFAFSEDDTVILSLDKAGTLKFWDVVDLVDEANGRASKIAPIELKTAMLTFATANSTEKAWPTSVMFADKLRPYTKGIAQRYILVGMKQNHTLQLWDLCLLKTVQELNFPHDKETDAICSIAYHPSSGIVVVGHPTRNSIYFIHLSAPKYNLPSMSQAKFIHRLADKDSTLPRPEATAIMSGLREYSFASIGQIRSLDLVSIDESKRIDVEGEEDPPLFELYVMHSRGVTSLSVNKADLGWSKESKVLHPVDAEAKKSIVVKELREPSQAVTSEQSSFNGDQTAATSTPKSKTKPTGRTGRTPQRKTRNTGSEEQVIVDPSSNAERIDEEAPATTNGTSQKAEKKKKKRDAASSVPAVANTVEPASKGDQDVADPPPAANSDTQKVEEKTQPTPKPTIQDEAQTGRSTQPMANGESTRFGISGDFLGKELEKIEHGVSAEFKRVFAHELETLYRRIDDDKRAQSAAGAAKQDAILRLVSATLRENVQQSLSEIIQTNIQEAVIPAVNDIASTAVSTSLDRRLPEIVTQQLHVTMPPLLKLALPEAISRGVQSPEVLRLLSEQLTGKLTSHVEREFSTALHKTIMPAFQNLTVNLAQKVSNEAEVRIQAHLQRAESQHRQDSVKIDQLTELVRGLSETVHAMAGAQSEFQQEILKLQQQVMQERRTNSGDTDTSHQSSVQKSPEQEVIDSVAELIDSSNYEEGIVQWIQSDYQKEVFDGCLASHQPDFLHELSPLLNLSISVAVTSSLDTMLSERLTWFEAVFATLNPGDPELKDVGARIMEVLRERLESGFMQISVANPSEPALRRIPTLAHH
ncbi:MAG: hypothetical protein Q9223_007315, partial [Gallowayella weberi]